MAYKRHDKKANEKGLKSSHDHDKSFNQGFAKARRTDRYARYTHTVDVAAKAFTDTVQAAVELGKAQVGIMSTLAEKVEKQDAKECFQSTLTFLQNVDQNSNETYLKALDMTYEFIDNTIEKAMPLVIAAQKLNSDQENKKLREELDCLKELAKEKARDQPMKKAAR